MNVVNITQHEDAQISIVSKCDDGMYVVQLYDWTLDDNNDVTLIIEEFFHTKEEAIAALHN